MPLRSPTTSEPLRSRLTTALMAFVLAGSLGLAYSISDGSRPSGGVTTVLRAGPIAVEATGRWVPISESQPIPGVRVGVRYANDPTNDQLLTLGRLQESSLRAPTVALNAAVKLLFGDDAHEQVDPQDPVIRVTSGPMTGQIYAGVRRVGDELRIRVLSVVTIDGRTYWMIAVEQRTPSTPAAGKQLEAATKLVHSTVLRMEDQLFQRAGDDELQGVGLSRFELLKGLDAVVQLGPDRGRIPLLIPEERLGQLQVWRVRVLPDMTDAPAGLSPDRLLANDFRQAMGREPRGNESWTGRILDYPAWRVGHALAPQGLTRQVFYVQMPTAEGLLIEMLAEPGVVSAASPWLDAIVAGVDRALGAPRTNMSAPAEGTVTEALDRGRDLVDQQRATLAGYLRPGWRYTLIETDGRPIGCEVMQVGDNAASSRYPIRGRTVTLAFAARHVRIVRVWATNPDGTEWWCQTLHRVGASDQPDPQVGLTRTSLTDGELSIGYGTDPSSTVWTAAAPEGLIGPAVEDYWPGFVSGNTPPGPSLVWMTHGAGPPQPYWVQGIAETPETPETPGGPRGVSQGGAPWAAQMLIRPFVAIEADRAYIGQDGRIDQHTSRKTTGLFRGATVVSRTVDRETLTGVFPAMEGLLGSWEHDEPLDKIDNVPQP